MKEIILVLVGGIIGISSGVITTILTHKFKKSETKREELLNSYINWSKCVYEVLERWVILKNYDNINKLKEIHSDIKNVPCDPGGHSREELVNFWREASSKLRIAEYKILLLESEDRFILRMKDISGKGIEGMIEENNPLIIFEFKDNIVREVEKFLKELQKSHPIISK